MAAGLLLAKFRHVVQGRALRLSADVGTYHLDEEYDRDYKKNLLEVPSRMLRKH